MNDHQQMDELIKFITTSAESGKDFVVTQAPYLVREIVAWYFWTSIIAALCCVTFSVIFALMGRTIAVNKKYQEWLGGRCNDPPQHWILYVFSLALVACMFLQISYAVKACVAPRVVVLEKVSGLLHR